VGRGQGQRTEPGFPVVRALPLGELECDFCSRPAVWKNPAADSYIGPISCGFGDFDQISEGAWAACDRCQRLINDGNRRGLAERSADVVRSMSDPPLDQPMHVLIGELEAIQVAFWKVRRGGPELIR